MSSSSMLNEEHLPLSNNSKNGTNGTPNRKTITITAPSMRLYMGVDGCLPTIYRHPQKRQHTRQHIVIQEYLSHPTYRYNRGEQGAAATTTITTTTTATAAEDI